MRALEKARDSPNDPSKPDHAGMAQPAAAPPMRPHGLVFDPDNDDAVMEDALPAPRRRERTPLKIAQAPVPSDQRGAANKVRRAPNPTQSELSKRVNTGQLLDKILNTQLTLTVGEALGTSHNIAHSLSEALKYKRPTEIRENLVGATIFNRNRGELISLTLECDGRPLEALVDTGSMLNVMSKRVWQNVVRRPLEPAETKSMRDANSGEKPLMGKVSHVPFTCGGAVLFANVFVAAHVEFDLLLGRPWQQDNQVSISERRDGTYLIFDPPWMSGGPMELFVGTTTIPSHSDGPYMPIAVPVFSTIAPRVILSGKSEKSNEAMMPYLPARNWEAHEDPDSDVIVQAGVPRALAFPRGMGDWLGHPFEDWEVPGSSLVVTE